MNQQNRTKLTVLLDVFGISVADAARTIGVSRPLLSRIVSGDPNVRGDFVWAKLERQLSQLIEKRQRAFFAVDAVPAETVKAAFASLEAEPNAAA